MTPTKNAPPDTATFRIVRGGSWDDFGADWVRAAVRSWDAQANRNTLLGFRTSLAGRKPQ